MSDSSYQNRKNILLFFFWCVGAGVLAAIIFSLDALHFVCKPFIMATLCLYYFQNIKREDRSNVLILAIIFSLIGDVLLMIKSELPIYFMLGLISFLIAHVFYILAYRSHRFESLNTGLQGVQKVRFAFPIILMGTGLIVVLYPSLGDLKFPVTIYALIMVVMVLNALFRYGHTSSKSFWMVFAGAILFMISDSILAINKFLKPIDYGNLMVMSFYIVAQFLIVRGLIEHQNQRSRKF